MRPQAGHLLRRAECLLACPKLWRVVRLVRAVRLLCAELCAFCVLRSAYCVLRSAFCTLRWSQSQVDAPAEQPESGAYLGMKSTPPHKREPENVAGAQLRLFSFVLTSSNGPCQAATVHLHHSHSSACYLWIRQPHTHTHTQFHQDTLPQGRPSAHQPTLVRSKCVQGLGWARSTRPKAAKSGRPPSSSAANNSKTISSMTI